MAGVNLDREETKLERLRRRDTAIQKKYDDLRSKKFQGSRLYSHEAVIAMVAHEFYLSRNHINNIINGYNKYQRIPIHGDQGSLFEGEE